MNLPHRLGAAAGAGGLLLAGLTAAAATPAAAGSSCVGLSTGVQRQVSYTSRLSNGATLSGATLAAVSRAGAIVTAKVKILALPAGASCADLTLASYRASSVPMTATSYQTLYAWSSARHVKVGWTAKLTVKIPGTRGKEGGACDNASWQYGKDGKQRGDKNKGFGCDKNHGKGHPGHCGCDKGKFWQIDLVTGCPALPYIGTPPGGGKVLSYGSIAGSPKRLLDAAIGGA